MNRRRERGTPIDTLGAAGRRDAPPPSSLPPQSVGGRAARRPPPHPVKRGGGGEEAGEGEGEGTDPAAAVEVVGPVSQVVVVSWTARAGRKPVHEEIFRVRGRHCLCRSIIKITDVCTRFLS